MLSTAIENGYRRILCDIEGLDYASSPGLLALDAAGERVRRSGGELLLCGLTGPVRIALELSGIEPHFDVAECRPSALARWAHGRSASSEE